MIGGRLNRIINYLFVFLAINYNLLVQFVIHVDSTGYGLLGMAVLVFVLNAKSIKRLQLSKPIMFWLVWCMFVVLNYFIHPHVSPIGVGSLIRKVFVPLLLMTIVAKEFQDEYRGLLICCAVTFGVYAFFGQYFDSGILYRNMGEDNVLGNSYAIISSFCMLYLALLNNDKRLKLPFFILLAVLLMLVLAMSGTRKAFGAGCVMLIFWILSMLNLSKVYTWIFVLLISVGGGWGYEYLIENTYMGERMELLEYQQDKKLPPQAPKFLAVFGDRAPHYYYGWQQFLKHPLFGNGLGQTRVDWSYIHSEYMVQLTDNGLIGFVLFCFLYGWIGLRLLKRFRNRDDFTICMLGGFACVLFLDLTAWSWEFPHYFVVLGTLIGYNKTMPVVEENDVELSI